MSDSLNSRKTNWYIVAGISALVGAFIVFAAVRVVTGGLRLATAKVAQRHSAPVNYPHGAPIASATSQTEEKLCHIYKAWGRRLIIDQYKNTPGARQDIAKFLEDGMSFLVGLNHVGEAECAREVAAIAQSGINDPAWQLFAGLVIQDAPAQVALLQGSVAQFDRSQQYSRFLGFMAAANLGKMLSNNQADASRVTSADEKALAWLEQGLNAESFREEELPALAWRMKGGSVDSLITRRPEELIRIIDGAVAVPAWMRHYLAGRVFLRRAWDARGSGWSNEVTDQGWRRWEQNLGNARKRLTQSWDLNPNDPAAAAELIEVSMGDGSGKVEMRRWFDRAVAAQIDSAQAYKNMMWGLRPRWFGSHQEMLTFGRECVATQRYDTWVPYYYVNLVREVASEQGDHDAIYKTEEGRLAREVVQTYLRRPTPVFSPAYGHTLAAILAYKAGDRAAAAAQLAAIQFQPDQATDLVQMENLAKMVQELTQL